MDYINPQIIIYGLKRGGEDTLAQAIDEAVKKYRCPAGCEEPHIGVALDAKKRQVVCFCCRCSKKDDQWQAEADQMKGWPDVADIY